MATNERIPPAEETLEKIEESRAARLAGNQDQHRALSRRTRTLLGRDKERYVRSLAEDVEGHLNANDLRPAYRALKKLRSKSPSRASAIRAADGRLVSDMDGQMARWAEYFEQLFTVDPPTEQLHTTGLRTVDTDPPIDETAPSLDEVREAVAKLSGGKAAGVCNISAGLLKAGGEAMIRGLHAVLTAVWQSGTIPPDWKRGLVVPIWKGKGDRQDCNNYRGITLFSVPGKVFTHLLLTRIRSHLLKHQRAQQSGFTPGKSTTDRILALRVLVERRREFRQGMLAAHVDLKKAFDSVHLIFAESLEFLVMALEALHEEAKPLELEVSWLKTKFQVFGGLLDETVQSVHACGVDIEILETHINHVRTMAGVDYVGLGAGFDGMNRTPVGLEDVSKYPELFAELLKDSTWSLQDLKKLAGLNLLRVMFEVNKALKLRKQSAGAANPPFMFDVARSAPEQHLDDVVAVREVILTREQYVVHSLHSHSWFRLVVPCRLGVKKVREELVGEKPSEEIIPIHDIDTRWPCRYKFASLDDTRT
ncbi:Dipeptidase 3 [Chionoecetes opilio]|uniref:Dipeptidase 3 n=1 Tax=Chionoecetes opilio TaxID=41210 RepID=A0A8J4YN81_CHIOP|nr:Dipeptidase 3 [Chionoecetes opilio]